MSIIAVGAIGICSVIVGMILKNIKPEYSIIISVAVCALIALASSGKVLQLVELAGKITDAAGINKGYMITLIKITGITYVAEIMSDLCKDSGFVAIGNQITIFGKLSILIISMPIIMALIETIRTIL